MIFRERGFNVQILNSFHLNLDARIAQRYLYLLNTSELTILEHLEFRNMQIEYYNKFNFNKKEYYERTFEGILNHKDQLVKDLKIIESINGTICDS